MILSQRVFNTELQLHHTHDGAVFSFDDLCQFHGDSSLVESVFDVQSQLQRLSLTDEENCVLAAFSVMFAGTWTSAPRRDGGTGIYRMGTRVREGFIATLHHQQT